MRVAGVCTEYRLFFIRGLGFMAFPPLFLPVKHVLRHETILHAWVLVHL